MVVANIVADVIIGLSPLVRPMLAPGGLFLCSGIIDDRAQEVADRLRENGWEILETRSAEGWFPISAAEQELEKRGSDLRTLGRLDGFLGGHMAPVVICCVALGIAFPEVLST